MSNELNRIIEELHKIIILIGILIKHENSKINKIKLIIERQLPENYPNCDKSQFSERQKGYYSALFTIKFNLLSKYEREILRKELKNQNNST